MSWVSSDTGGFNLFIHYFKLYTIKSIYEKKKKNEMREENKEKKRN